jgi:hypothetical protein
MTKFKNILVAAFSIIFFSPIVNAQAVPTSYSVNAEQPLKVKYLSDDGEYLHFQVTVNSHETTKGKFAISDKTEGTLYSSAVATGSTVTNIKVAKKDEDQVLTFELFVGKETFSKSFSVNTSVVETLTVLERDITKL